MNPFLAMKVYPTEKEQACELLREWAKDAAMRGNRICGAYFALRDERHAAFLDDISDSDEEEELP